MPCFQFLNIWHLHFLFFAFIFLTFTFWEKKNSTSCEKTCRSYINQNGFSILWNELFFAELLFWRATQTYRFQTLDDSGVIYILCGVGAEWDVKLNQLRLMKSNLPPKKSHKLTFEFSLSPLWSCQSESNLFSANGEYWGRLAARDAAFT